MAAIRDTFYEDLKCFQRFDGITERGHFKEVPKDWWVVITDVKGSTQAIEQGRYKEVNTVGAASIVAVSNALGGLDFPYVFGGDGASILIPDTAIDAVRKELIALKRLSLEQFQLHLRVGAISVADILAGGRALEVGRFELVPRKSVAIFRGGGMSFAEERIKSDPKCYEWQESASSSADLTGLSCRWQPIPSKNGCILSLLVQAKHEDGDEVYRRVLNELNHILGDRMEAANPMHDELMSYRSLKACIRDERRYHTHWLSASFLMRFAEICASVLVFKMNIPPLLFSPKNYQASIRRHSDYRKFDDMLRIVIDCSSKQVEAITAFLENEHKKGALYFGVHPSSSSLMTCFVQDIKEGGHIHFVDGGDGGYAIAAKQLKAQMKADR